MSNSTWVDVTVEVQPGVPTTFLAEVQTLQEWRIEAIDAEDGVTILAATTPAAGGGQFELRTLEWTPDAGRTEAILRIVWPLGQGLIAADIDNVGVATGLQPATPGKIVREMVEAAQARGTIPTVVLDFTDTNDSNGNLWTNVLSINFGHGQTLYEVLAQLVSQGFEWEIAPRFYTIGGDQGIVLSLYNGRARGPSFGIGDNQELTNPTGAATIRHGQVMAEAESTQVVPLNATLGEGAADPATGGTQVTQATDADSIAAIGRREDFFTNQQLLDAATLQDAAQTRLENLRRLSTSATVELLQASPYVPGTDFRLGDTIRVDLGDQIPAGWYRVARIGGDLAGEGDVDIRYVVDIGTVIVPEDAVVPVTLSRLIDLTQLRGQTPGSGQSTGATTGVAGSPIIIPSTAVPFHTHPYGEIVPGGLSGDLAGSNPEPRVAKIQGKDVTTATPAARDVLGWDDENNLWDLVRRMNWLNTWDPSVEQYEKGDTVRDGGFSMVANKATGEKPAPVPEGLPSWLLDDAPAWTTTSVSDVVRSGIRISNLERVYYAQALRVWVSSTAADRVYQLFIEDNNTGAVTAEAPFTGDEVPAAGWFQIGRPVWMAPGDDYSFILAQYSTNDGTPTTEPWNWIGYSNNVDPDTGEANADNPRRTIRIHKTDANAVDQAALLATVDPGTTIRIEDQADATVYATYLVVAPVDAGAFYGYDVRQEEVGAGGEPQASATVDITFTPPALDPMDVVSLPSYWSADPQIDGLYAEGTDPLATNDNAYGVDFYNQAFDAPEDWDLLAITAGLGSGGGGAASGGHIIRDEGVDLPQQPALDFVGSAVTVTDDPGTTATRVTIDGPVSGALSVARMAKTAPQPIPSGTPTAVTWDVQDWAYGSAVTPPAPGGTAWTVNVTDRYRMDAFASVADGVETGSAINDLRVMVYVNGVDIQRWLTRFQQTGDSFYGYGGSIPLDLQAGDIVELWVHGGSGTSPNWDLRGLVETWMALQHMPGPAEVAGGPYLPLAGSTEMAGDIQYTTALGSPIGLDYLNQGLSLNLGQTNTTADARTPFVDFYTGDTTLNARIISGSGGLFIESRVAGRDVRLKAADGAGTVRDRISIDGDGVTRLYGQSGATVLDIRSGSDGVNLHQTWIELLRSGDQIIEKTGSGNLFIRNRVNSANIYIAAEDGSGNLRNRIEIQGGGLTIFRDAANRIVARIQTDGNWDFENRILTDIQRIQTGNGSQSQPAYRFTSSSSGLWWDSGLSRVVLSRANSSIGQVNLASSAFLPRTDNAIGLGVSSGRWKDVWAVDGTINTSDERYKTGIRPLDDEALEAFFRRWEVIAYQWIPEISDSGRTHVGYGYWQTKEALEAAGVTPGDYGMLVDPTINPSEDEIENKLVTEDTAKGLRRSEAIGLNTRMIQILLERLDTMQARLDNAGL